MAKKKASVRGVGLDDKLVQELEKILMKIWHEELYAPLLKVVPAAKIENSKLDVLSAIRSGRLVFYRGQFKGPLTARLSRGLKDLGAKWDQTQGTWKIPLASLPQEYQEAIRLSDMSFNKTLTQFNKELGKILPESLAQRAEIQNFFDKAIFKIDKDVTKQLKAITVAPQLTQEEQLALGEEYRQNMDLYITDFTEQQIASLRDKVMKNFYSGNRYENLIQTIQKSYGVTESKAKFLARQETNLLTAKYSQVRYESAGSTGYYWRCVKGSPKHPVRPDHKKLDGEFIQWNSKPIVDSKTGRRAHAGEDFNCRCGKEVVLKL